ncbi:MAG TPA: Fic family protein [Pirellulales bacterium]|nr:Fic family protein [Pirellulales bacterium]
MPIPFHDDHYRVSANAEGQFMDDARAVLKNKNGITDPATLGAVEQEALIVAYKTVFSELHPDTAITSNLIRHVHATILGNLYEWAGRWRTVWISKPGVTWPAPDYLDDLMRSFEKEILRRYPAHRLTDDALFCKAAAEIQGEFLVIHPFREGNARTIKLVTDVLASQTDRPPLRYDESETGRQQYIQAALAAFDKGYGPMEDVIRSALERAKRRPPENRAGARASPS